MHALIALALVVAPAAARYEDAQSVATIAAQGGQLQVEITIKPGFHLNDDYPINFQPDFEASKVVKKQMTLIACVDHPKNNCSVKFGVRLPAHVKGKVGGLAAFAACDADVCLIKKVALAVSAGP